MTEKRFEMVITGVDGSFYYLDAVTGERIKSTLELENKLNELHEENQRLKGQICNLEHTRDFCGECCERLEKENEQLKSEIREVRGEYEQLWMRL